MGYYFAHASREEYESKTNGHPELKSSFIKIISNAVDTKTKFSIDINASAKDDIPETTENEG